MDGVPLLIDTGTSTYEPGPVRRYERSTAAHSTVQLDGADSTEVWGVFRAGRRARVSGLSARVERAGLSFDAAHDGFRRLPGRPRHRRRWSLTEDRLRVDDLISGRGRHEIVIRWQLAADSAVRIYGGTALVTGPAGAFRVAVEAADPVLLTDRDQAGRRRVRQHRRRARADLPDPGVAAGLGQHHLGPCPHPRGGHVKQVVQPVSGGPVQVLDVPRPTIGSAEVLVRTVASVISPGTERAVTALARSSLLAKARARPDLVRQVVRKARAEGVAAAAQAVRGRLAADLPLGYSAAGVVAEVGDAVDGIRVGQLVATGGAGKANHAEFQAVPHLLCAVVPDGVPAAGRGVRHPRVDPAARAAPVRGRAGRQGRGARPRAARPARRAAGDGLRLRRGRDRPRRARQEGRGRRGVLALDESGDATTSQILHWSRGRGADTVLVCAAGRSAEPMSRTPALCRDRATVVMVGDVGMPPRRTPYYEREISLLFARSYGPGRYEPSYEAWGVDYPAGQVRWTEGRNQEAVLDLLASGRLAVSDLVTHPSTSAARTRRTGSWRSGPSPASAIRPQPTRPRRTRTRRQTRRPAGAPEAPPG